MWRRVSESLIDQRMHVLDDRVHNVRTRQAAFAAVHMREARGKRRVPRKARGDVRERAAPAEVRILDHHADDRVQVRQASVVEIRRGERGVVHGTRQHAVVDLRVRAAGPQPVAGAAHEALRHPGRGETPVVEQSLSDQGAAAAVRQHGRERHEQARAGRVDPELAVEFRARGDFRGAQRRLHALAPRKEKSRRQDERRAHGGKQPRDTSLHFRNSFTLAFGDTTPSMRSISGNSGDHTRADP